MEMRRGDNKRESWWVKNKTKLTITIGDLLQVPAIKPGKRVDLLYYYSREKVSHSKVLVKLVKAGIVSLSKDKIFTNEFPGPISSSNIDEALTPAEENEVLKESEANDLFLKLNGSNAKTTIDIGTENFETKGSISGINVTSGLNPGHLHDIPISTTEHNILPGLQGGDPSNDEFYHLTQNQINKIDSLNNIITITGDYTSTSDDHTILCNTTSGSLTVTLPASSKDPGKLYYIKKIDVSENTTTIDGNLAELIDGGLTAIITIQYESITIQNDGSNWHIL